MTTFAIGEDWLLKIGLDTIAHGVLTAVRVCDRRLFQSGRTAIGEERNP